MENPILLCRQKLGSVQLIFKFTIIFYIYNIATKVGIKIDNLKSNILIKFPETLKLIKYIILSPSIWLPYSFLNAINITW